MSWLAAESLQILSVGWLVVTHNPRYSLTNINQAHQAGLPGLRHSGTLSLIGPDQPTYWALIGGHLTTVYVITTHLK